MASLTLQIWDRQADETGKAWAAFVIYRDLPSGERTLLKAAEKLSKNLTTIKNWSAKHHWVARVAEFDAFIDRTIAQETRLEVEREKAKMVERHTKTSVFIQNNLLETLTNMSDAEWNSLPPDRLAMLYIKVAQLERVSRGLPSDSIEVKTPEQIRQQQIVEATLYYEEIRHDYKILSDRDCLQIVCEAFEVKPSEIGFDDDDAPDDGEEPETE